jgi:hypothetical protein
MKHLTVRLQDSVHAALSAELKDWQKLRGPKFSLNNLCEEKLSTPFPPTQWVVGTGTTGTNNYAYTVTTVPMFPSIQEPEKKNAGKPRKS